MNATWQTYRWVFGFCAFNNAQKNKNYVFRQHTTDYTEARKNSNVNFPNFNLLKKGVFLVFYNLVNYLRLLHNQSKGPLWQLEKLLNDRSGQAYHYY